MNAITREELADLTGIGMYDEQYGRLPYMTLHFWPSTGKQAHYTSQSCWCRPALVGDDGEMESYQHRECH